jgi:hypothetical protein
MYLNFKQEKNMTDIYYVNFEGTPFTGKGTVQHNGHIGWYEMDQVSGCGVSQRLPITNKDFLDLGRIKSTKPGDLSMAATHLGAVRPILQSKQNTDVIKKIVVHRMRRDNDELIVDKEVVVKDARLAYLNSDPETELTQVIFTGFTTGELADRTTEVDGAIRASQLGNELRSVTSRNA